MQVLGVTLSDGEQVFYAHELDMQHKRKIGMLTGGGLALFGFVSMWFTCVTGLLIPVGGYILYKTLKPAPDTIVGLVLTDRRFVAIPFDASAGPDEVALGQIEDVECKRKGKKVAHGGSLAALAINAAAKSIQEADANKKAKTHPNYWTNAVEVHVLVGGGTWKKWNLGNEEGPNLGPLLATGLVRGWDALEPIEGAPAERTVSVL